MWDRLHRKRRWLMGAAVMGAAAMAIPLYLWVTFGFTYSRGARVGIVQRTSEAGWACQTYKGELAMGSEAGVTDKIFTFTVRDKAVATKIDDLAGRRVLLNYEQHKGVPSTCFGDSEYFVTEVRKL